MSEARTTGRPRQVTVAAAIAVAGAVLLVLSLFDTMARTRSVEMRREVADVLDRPPGSGLGLDVEQVLSLLRVLVLVSGALAAAAVVLAVFAAQRHRGARIGFTVAAGLLVLTVPIAGLLPLLLAFAALQLWSGPARDWYAGRPPAAPPAAARPSGGTGSETSRLASEPPGERSAWPGAGSPPPPPTPAPDAPDQPTPDPETTEQPTPAGQWPGPPAPGHDPAAPSQPGAGWPAQWPAPGGPGAPWPSTGAPGPGWPAPGMPGSTTGGPWAAPDRRPLTVTIAAILTWAGAGLVLLGSLALMGYLATSSEQYLEALREELDRANRDGRLTVDPTDDQLLAFSWAITGVVLAWSAIALVLAVLAFRRSNAARIALAVSAAVSALVSLLMILSIVSVAPLLLSGAAAVLLFTGGANAWFARRPPDPSYGAPGPWGAPPGGQQPPDQPGRRDGPW